MRCVVTRFAPSPSGSLHIGNLRVVLITWVFAYINTGLFIIRFDSTNPVCSFVQFQLACIQLLQAFNITYNLVFNQCQRYRIYQRFAWLLYLCCSAYFLNGALWFFTFGTFSGFFDYLRFKLITTIGLYSFVLIRSSGFPTYNFCSVIDDHLMKISYIIRGCDHLSNTFKQVILARTLGDTLGKFFHLPLIISTSGTKLSKQRIGITVLYLLRYGFLRKALVCYLLGIDLRYIYQSLPICLLTYFSLNSVLVSNLKYDISKLVCYNRRVITLLSFIRLYTYLANLYFSPLYLKEAIIRLVNTRSVVIKDIDYYYINYYLVLFSYIYVFVNKIIFYVLASYLEFNNCLIFTSKCAAICGSLTSIYSTINMFFFNSSVNIPALTVYLDSLGNLNIRLLLTFVLFI
ncbi:hypothetical protein JS520_00545 [Candidatus Vidania fulgoroideae]|nr:hypothetical protein JS520_00545 [Candidatus Vidania fulgoroideae]